jgi:hypothetical protein
MLQYKQLGSVHQFCASVHLKEKILIGNEKNDSRQEEIVKLLPLHFLFFHSATT